MVFIYRIISYLCVISLSGLDVFLIYVCEAALFLYNCVI